jgi:hypothetical protein
METSTGSPVKVEVINHPTKLEPITELIPGAAPETAAADKVHFPGEKLTPPDPHRQERTIKLPITRVLVVRH